MMLNNLTNDDRMLILSPHLDDAVLSAGGLIDRAVKQGSSVLAATVFTGDAELVGEPSPLVRELHEWWQLGPRPYAVRRQEDIASIELLGADYVHGGLLDSMYRSNAEGEPLYSTRKAVFSPPSSDDPVWEQLETLFAGWVDSFKPSVVLCPMTVGRHADHVATAEVARGCWRDWDADVYLYEDIPYSIGRFPPDYPDSVAAAMERMNWKTRGFEDVGVDFGAKFAAITKYESQLGEIFPGLDPEEELRRYMGTSERFKERFWMLE
jgi:LmbE family N-acetylglucosaminyl deacetylase